MQAYHWVYISFIKLYFTIYNTMGSRIELIRLEDSIQRLEYTQKMLNEALESEERTTTSKTPDPELDLAYKENEVVM